MYAPLTTPKRPLLPIFRFDEHVLDMKSVAVEGTLVWALHILAVLFIYLLCEACAYALEMYSSHIDIVCQIYYDVAVDVSIVDGVSQVFQLLTVTNHACATNRADVAYILVVCPDRLTLVVGIGYVAARSAVAVERAIGINHGM